MVDSADTAAQKCAGRASTGLIFSVIIVLIFTVLAFAAFCLFCSAPGQMAGYWSSSDGNLFEIYQLLGSAGGPQKGDYAVSTASGFWGASTDGVYPITKGCRSVAILFPDGELRGRIGLDRRRIVWDRAPTWYRQGI